MLIIYTLIFFLLLLYLLYNKNQNDSRSKYFKKHGIFNFGSGNINILKMFFAKETVMGIIHSQYKRMTEAKAYLGVTSQFGSDQFLISDAGMLRNIFVKDFDHFSNRQGQFQESHSLMNNSLVFMNGSPWKSLRSKLSPTFTTGKIKRLFPLFDQSAKKLVDYIQRKSQDGNGEILLNAAYSKLTMDIIASAVCGIDSQTFDQEEPSLFESMAKKMQLSLGPIVLFRFILSTQFPKLASILGVTLFGKSTEDFFSNVINANIESRLKNGISRQDFLQLMIEAREGKLKLDESELDSFEREAQITVKDKSNPSKELLNDDVIAANCALFFLAGYDPTRSLLMYVSYVLALHPEIQEKLRIEIDSLLEENDGEFNYETLMQMKYLDMVVNETLRMYPPAMFTDRDCSEDYKFPGTDFILEKGQRLTIPIYEMHHDESNYSEPEKFDPERFSPERKAEINQYTFLPFGHGPRNCIGMRFALAEVKLVIAHLVHNFDMQPSSRTLIPMEFENTTNLKPKGGMFLSFTRRT